MKNGVRPSLCCEERAPRLPGARTAHRFARGPRRELGLASRLQTLTTMVIPGNTTPEQRLMLGVLADAMRLHRRTVGYRDRRSRRLCAETLEWFRSDDLSWPFSFLNICHVLGLDADGLRSRVARDGAGIVEVTRTVGLVPDAPPLRAAAAGGR